MTPQLILLKLQQRLSKLGSEDFGNVDPWMYIEAFNKAQLSWIRRQLEGINQTRTGAEGSVRKIDDLQFILITEPLIMTDGGDYWVAPLPGDYLQWSRVSGYATKGCSDCPARQLIIFESIEADLDINLNDSGKQPNYDWATTLATVSDKAVKIYTNGEFDITNPTLTYYRAPVNIQMAGVANPFNPVGAISVTDVPCEAADNIAELIIDEAVTILSTDIHNYQLTQVTEQRLNQNT